MKDKHRSKKLDAFLGQKVTIIFKDDTIQQGVLIWNDEAGKPPLYLSKRGYYLEYNTGIGYIGFAKSCVKKIQEYRS